ncbi:MAG: tyrosine-type recombinase/integrase [Streptomyces sp.]|nr:tyrosine-type recombinase/integrase [Streptomyces sp.]
MAGHVQDRWYKTEDGPDGKPVRAKTDRYGTGMRYRARYIGPDGTEKSKSFPDRAKRKADEWLANIEADMSRGQYVDPRSNKVTLSTFAETWLAGQTTDLVSQDRVERQIRLHVLPYLGSRPLSTFQPSHIRAWTRALEDAGLSTNYRRVIYNTASAVFNAAVDDGYLMRSPFRAATVRPPKRPEGRLKPWTADRVFAVRDAIDKRVQATVDLGAGCGMRQGEIFGLAVDEVDDTAGVVHVVCQVKLISHKRVFAPPKGGKLRDVPLPLEVSAVLAEHVKAYPPVKVTLPWGRPDGPLVTKLLYFTNGLATAYDRNHFNGQMWKPALVAAGVIPNPEPGETFAESREHGMHALRHFYASVLLDGGESIKALSAYLGHSDPGFTLRTYTHLMPASEDRTRRTVDGMYRANGRTQTAQRRPG